MVAVLGASVLSFGRAWHLLSTAANCTLVQCGGCAAPRFRTMLTAPKSKDTAEVNVAVSFDTCWARRGEDSER
jgi:predicted metal-binding protein